MKELTSMIIENINKELKGETDPEKIIDLLMLKYRLQEEIIY